MRKRTVVTFLFASIAGCDQANVTSPISSLPSSSLSIAATDTILIDGDTYVKKGKPNQNQGDLPEIRLRASGNNRGLLSIDKTTVVGVVGERRFYEAEVVLTISDNGSNWGSGGRWVAIHRLLAPWSELGATWNCGVDLDLDNQAADCSATDWEMGKPGQPDVHPWLQQASDSVLITNASSGEIRFNVTEDVATLLASEVGFGWIVRKTNEGASGRVEFHSRETAHGARLELVLGSEVPDTSGFPATPPNSIPADVFSTLDPAYHIPPDLIEIAFLPGLTPAEKDAVLATVGGGVVLGGTPTNPSFADGFYLVRFDSINGGAAVLDAREALAAHPSVITALPLLRSEAAWRQPNDGVGDWSMWSPDRSAIGGENWALQQIGLPLAWACETGDPGVPVGLLDSDFPLNSELFGNVTPVGPFGPPQTPPVPPLHGNFVASILAAEGGNGAGMTGVMWNAQVLGAQYGPTLGGEVAAFEDVIRRGVRVLNLSLQTTFKSGFTPSPLCQRT